MPVFLCVNASGDDLEQRYLLDSSNGGSIHTNTDPATGPQANATDVYSVACFCVMEQDAVFWSLPVVSAQIKRKKYD